MGNTISAAHAVAASAAAVVVAVAVWKSEMVHARMWQFGCCELFALVVERDKRLIRCPPLRPHPLSQGTLQPVRAAMIRRSIRSVVVQMLWSTLDLTAPARHQHERQPLREWVQTPRGGKLLST